ncbi:MAG: hypothetical protein WCT18_00030 [Patescibacteria group bacterium]
MEKPTIVNEKSKEELLSLAQKLEELQKVENNGRGVSCLRLVVEYLKMGQLGAARQVCFTDGDKIFNYPLVVDFIKKNLFKSTEDHPWFTYERLKKMEDVDD